MRFRRQLGALMLGLAGLAAGCGPASAPPAPGRAPLGASPPVSETTRSIATVPAAPATALERVRIAYSSTSLTVLTAFIAQEQGYYQQQGLEAELVQAAPRASLAALSTGELDYALSFGSTVRAAARGLPIRVVNAALQAPQFLLVARPEIRDGADLRGKLLGVTSIGGLNHQVAGLFAAHHGLDPRRDVEMIGIGEEAALFEALRLGQVQAVPVAPPFPVLAEREGYRLLGNAAELFPVPATGVGANLDKLDRGRAQTVRVVAAEIQALRHVRAARDATVDAIARRFSMERDVAARSYELVLPSFSADGRLSRAGLQHLLELDREAGASDTVPPLDTIADFEIVEEALALLDRR